MAHEEHYIKRDYNIAKSLDSSIILKPILNSLLFELNVILINPLNLKTITLTFFKFKSHILNVK